MERQRDESCEDLCPAAIKFKEQIKAMVEDVEVLFRKNDRVVEKLDAIKTQLMFAMGGLCLNMFLLMVDMAYHTGVHK